jgi:excisionase family DNA binding protein
MGNAPVEAFAPLLSRIVNGWRLSRSAAAMELCERWSPMTGAYPPLGRNSPDAAMTPTSTPVPNPFDPLVEAIAKRTAEILRHDLGLEAKRLLTVKEAADYISRSERSLRQMIANGALPVIREGRAVRLDRRVLDEWIDLREFKR